MLRSNDTEVLVVGGGKRIAAERLVQTLKLPFPVLADDGRAVYRRYGLHKVFFLLQRSGTVLVDKEGIVRYVHRATDARKSLDPDELMQHVEAL